MSGDDASEFVSVVNEMGWVGWGILAAAIVALIVSIVYRYASKLPLRVVSATLIEPGQERELERTVENLCIGAGLPTPTLYIIDSEAANAFSAGLKPEHSSMVVTRGLMRLLDRRELEGIMAQELTQIGNYDTRLKTVVAAFVALLLLPIALPGLFIRLLFRLHWIIGAGCLAWVMMVVGLMVFGVIAMLSQDALVSVMGPQFRFYLLGATMLVFHVFVIAPAAGLLIRGAISKQREFLADAEAVLLTRNPEGLARALTKLGTLGNAKLQTSPLIRGLFVVDPLAERKWSWAGLLSSHPSLDERVAVLARSGSIPASLLEKARQDGKRYWESTLGGDSISAES